MINLEFIILAYSFGPIVAIPYALKYLSINPLELFFFLSVLYIVQLPVIFRLFEFGSHRKVYRREILKKICKSCGIKAKEEIDKIEKRGSDLINYFQERLGHLGFYFAISIFTFLFGIFWAAFLSYLLKVKRKHAIVAISFGIIFGNFFWIIVIRYSLPLINMEIIVILIVVYLLFYGRKRELQIIRKIEKKIQKEVLG